MEANRLAKLKEDLDDFEWPIDGHVKQIAAIGASFAPICTAVGEEPDKGGIPVVALPGSGSGPSRPDGGCWPSAQSGSLAVAWLYSVAKQSACILVY